MATASSGFKLPGWLKYLVIIGVVVFALGAILLPSLCKPRETANRIKCMANLRAIAETIRLYTNENHGAFPNQLSDLITTEDVTPPVFICPSSSDEAFEAKTAAEQVIGVNTPGHLSYVYLKENGGKPGKAMLYEPLKNHDGDGMNVVYGDLTSEFLSFKSDFTQYGIPAQPTKH